MPLALTGAEFPAQCPPLWNEHSYSPVRIQYDRRLKSAPYALHKFSELIPGVPAGKIPASDTRNEVRKNTSWLDRSKAFRVLLPHHADPRPTTGPPFLQMPQLVCFHAAKQCWHEQ